MPSGLRTAVGVVICVAAEGAGIQAFDSFIQSHRRTYEKRSEEYKLRRSLYEQRSAKAEAQNKRQDNIWVAGVNKFWDWTDAELMTLRGWDGSKPVASRQRAVQPHKFLQQHPSDLPAEVMWGNLTSSHQIVDQGSCGSCWAVSAATVLEMNHEIHKGARRTFSAQQITSCTPNPQRCGGDGGCKGATAELAMEWVLQNGCAETSAVPYQGTDAACTAHWAGGALGGNAFGMTGWETLPLNVYEPLARALVERGPAVVSVAAGEWYYYSNGVFDGCGKDATVDHAVVAVGYGIDHRQNATLSGMGPKVPIKYWRIQNSWGTDWGEHGYIRLQRHVTEKYCGTNYKPELGVACRGDTDPVPVCGMCGVLFDSVVPHFN